MAVSCLFSMCLILCCLIRYLLSRIRLKCCEWQLRIGWEPSLLCNWGWKYQQYKMADAVSQRIQLHLSSKTKWRRDIHLISSPPNLKQMPNDLSRNERPPSCRRLGLWVCCAHPSVQKALSYVTSLTPYIKGNHPPPPPPPPCASVSHTGWLCPLDLSTRLTHCSDWTLPAQICGRFLWIYWVEPLPAWVEESEKGTSTVDLL